jgi:hypothetical protein
MKATIDQIANRANELSGSMSHGNACFAACKEFEVEPSELSSTAAIVSTVLTNRDLNPRQATPEEIQRKADIEALMPKHLAALLSEMEAAAYKRGNNWGQKAISALRRGQPRWEAKFEARRRAELELDSTRK